MRARCLDVWRRRTRRGRSLNSRMTRFWLAFVVVAHHCFDVDCAYVTCATAARTRPRTTRQVMGWSDPDWRWGSAMGTAHNAAAELRSCLADKEARVRFTAETAAGNCDPEDVKLVLALKCQRARNLGYDPTGEWEVRCLFHGHRQTT